MQALGQLDKLEAELKVALEFLQLKNEKDPARRAQLCEAFLGAHADHARRMRPGGGPLRRGAEDGERRRGEEGLRGADEGGRLVAAQPGQQVRSQASRGQGEGHHPRPGEAQGIRQEVQAGGSGGPGDPHLHRGRLQVHQSGGRQPEGPSRAAEARRRRQADRLDGRAAPARPFQGQERDRAQAIGEGARRVRGGQEEEPGGGRRAARRHGDGGVQEAAEEDRARSIAAPA